MQKEEIRLEDDLTGGPADETVSFGLDGRAYEIDLNSKNAQRFRKQLSLFVDHARHVRRRRQMTVARTVADRERSRAIRQWAEQEGYDVAAHGRLPASVIAEYDRTQSSTPNRQAGRTVSRRRRT